MCSTLFGCAGQVQDGVFVNTVAPVDQINIHPHQIGRKGQPGSVARGRGRGPTPSPVTARGWGRQSARVVRAAPLREASSSSSPEPLAANPPPIISPPSIIASLQHHQASVERRSPHRGRSGAGEYTFILFLVFGSGGRKDRLVHIVR
jgi:hypothetical protein